MSRCAGSKQPPGDMEGDMATCAVCGREWLALYPNDTVVCHLPIEAPDAPL